MNYDWPDAVRISVREHEAAMLETERAIWTHPQTGFKEWFAHNYLKEHFVKMGFTLVEAGNIPGFYTDIETGRPGPTLCIMGELDSVICREHPESDPQTGAVHSCGHNCQSATLIGIAGALKNKAILDRLSGRIRIMAVPAEELLEIGERSQMRREGKISYLGGKVEFISRGYFEGVDMALLIHTANGDKPGLMLDSGSNGCLSKHITYIGKAAHAGASPQHGINALYAAQTGLNAIHALRETFPDEDHIRVHPIVTSGGSIVNTIPSRVTLESYVRGATFEAIKKNNAKVNRALVAGALALGAQVVIEDQPGYMPLYNDANLQAVMRDAGVALLGEEAVSEGGWSTGSTDVGDVGCIMPAIMPYCTGAQGTGHGADYYITHPEFAVVQSAELQVCAACALLEKGAERAIFVKEHASPMFSDTASYLKAIDSLRFSGETIEYGENGDAKVRWTN